MLQVDAAAGCWRAPHLEVSHHRGGARKAFQASWWWLMERKRSQEGVSSCPMHPASCPKAPIRIFGPGTARTSLRTDVNVTKWQEKLLPKGIRASADGLAGLKWSIMIMIK